MSVDGLPIGPGIFTRPPHVLPARRKQGMVQKIALEGKDLDKVAYAGMCQDALAQAPFHVS